MRRLLSLIAAAAVAAVAIGTHDATLLTALPVLGIFVLLANGRYVGADAYVARLRKPPRVRRGVPVAVMRSRLTTRPHGAVVLGANLGRRGPPALVPAA